MDYCTSTFHAIEDELRSCIRYAISDSKRPVFDALIDVFKTYYERPCHNMAELKKRTQKSKGTAFEVFCVMWLKAKGYNDVWMLSETPQDVLTLLGLTTYDCGIDLIARVNKNDKLLYFPIQCKYRKPVKNRLGQLEHKVKWADVSTFLSLCTRSGVEYSTNSRGWTKHIIMTNADNVCWRGKKTQKDYTIAKKTFENCNNMFWIKFLSKTQSEPVAQEIPITESIRDKRQAWLDRLALKV